MRYFYGLIVASKPELSSVFEMLTAILFSLNQKLEGGRCITAAPGPSCSQSGVRDYVAIEGFGISCDVEVPNGARAVW